jgi:hypothetical protein
MRLSVVLFAGLYLALAFVLGSAVGHRVRRARNDAQKAHALRLREARLAEWDQDGMERKGKVD